MFASWLNRVFGKSIKPSRCQRRSARPVIRPTFRPHVEALEDRMLLSATLPVSVNPAGTAMGNTSSVNASNAGNNGQSVSANGQYEVFISNATNLVNGITIQPGTHIYLRNLISGKTTLVDVAIGGTKSGDAGANYASITADGRYVAFRSDANDLTNNGHGNSEVYVRDMATGQTYLVSLGTDGKPDNRGPSGGSYTPSIAEDGKGHLFIAYESMGTNMTPGDSSNNNDRILLASLNLSSSGAIQSSTLKTKLVSIDNSTTGNGGNGSSFNPVLSKNGSVLTFDSYATNLKIPGGYNDNAPNIENLYLYSLTDQTLKLVSGEPTTTTATTGNQASHLPSNGDEFDSAYQESVSANGQYAVFISSSDNLVPGITTLGDNAFLRNLSTGTTSLVSVSTTGTSEAGGVRDVVITPDGRYVAFVSDSPYLPKGNGRSQVFVRDMQQGQTYLVSLGADGNAANGGGAGGQISIAETSNGQLVIAYSSASTNLTAHDTNSTNNQVFITTLNLDSKGNIEYNTRSTKLASATSSSNGGNDEAADPILSKDGSTLAFESKATNLPGETPDHADGHDHIQVFTYSIATGKLTQVSPAAPSGDTTDSSWLSSISDNGKYLSYDYYDNKAGAGEVYAWNANSGKNTVIYATKGAVYPVLSATLISGDGSTIAFRAGNVYGHAVIYATHNWQSGAPTITQVSASPSSSVFSSEDPTISDNGQVIAYHLTPGSGPEQIYVYDKGVTTLASAASSGGFSNGRAEAPEVSADGSKVVFDSTASNMVAGITDFVANLGFSTHDNVFAYNVAGKTVSLVSAKAPGLFTAGLTFTDGNNNAASLSDNGQYLTFWSSANDLLGNLPDTSNVFAENLQTGVLTLIASGSQAIISGDGSTVAFQSSQHLTSNDVKGGAQIFTATNWQTAKPTFTLVSVDSAGTDAGNQSSENPSISDNGKVVAFDSIANNLVKSDPNAKWYTQIFVRNLATDTTILASSNSAGTDGGNNNSNSEILSADGSTVIYDSYATNLVSGVSVPNSPNVYAYRSNTSQPLLAGNPTNKTAFGSISGVPSATPAVSNVPFTLNDHEHPAIVINGVDSDFMQSLELTLSSALMPQQPQQPQSLQPPVSLEIPLPVSFDSLLAGIEAASLMRDLRKDDPQP